MSELRYTKDGVPIYDGTSENYVSYRRAALVYVETLEWRKRALAGPRLQAALEGSARIAAQHKMPGWVSHQEGAVALLDFLKTQVQPPTLAEAGKMISRFFYSVKRRKGESMQQWIVRHDEALFEARRALAEAIQEYGGGESRTPSSFASTSALATLSGRQSHRGARSSTRSEALRFPLPMMVVCEKLEKKMEISILKLIRGIMMIGTSPHGGTPEVMDGGPTRIGIPNNRLSSRASMRSLMQPAQRPTASCRTLWWLGCCFSVLG